MPSRAADARIVLISCSGVLRDAVGFLTAVVLLLTVRVFLDLRALFAFFADLAWADARGFDVLDRVDFVVFLGDVTFAIRPPIWTNRFIYSRTNRDLIQASNRESAKDVRRDFAQSRCVTAISNRLR